MGFKGKDINHWLTTNCPLWPQWIILDVMLSSLQKSSHNEWRKLPSILSFSAQKPFSPPNLTFICFALNLTSKKASNMNIAIFYTYRIFSVWTDIAKTSVVSIISCCKFLFESGIFHSMISSTRLKKILKKIIWLTTNWKLKMHNNCFRVRLLCSSVIYILLKNRKIYRNPFYWKKPNKYKRKQLLIFLQILVGDLPGSLKRTYFFPH